MRRWTMRLAGAAAVLAAAAGAARAQDGGAPEAAEQPEPVVAEGVIAAPVAAVWDAFATPEGWVAKLGVAKADVSLRVGGVIRTCYAKDAALGGPETIENEVLAFEPERLLAIRIRKPPAAFPWREAWKTPWTVITLSDLDGRRTHVRIAMLGWRADDESRAMREFFAQGNALTLGKLRETCEAVSGAAPAAETSPLASIDVTGIVPGARADVWRAFTTAGGWKRFFDVGASIGAAPGGPFEIYFAGDAPAGQRGSEGCKILSLVPDEMFSFDWNAPPHLAAARRERTWVVVAFEDEGPRATRVRLRHLGFAEQAAAHATDRAEWTETRAYFAKAWPAVLGALAESFAARGESGGD